MGRTGRVAVPPDTTCSPPPNSLRYVLPPILPFARHPSAPLCFVSVRPPAIAARREVGPTAHVAPYHSSLLWRPIVLSFIMLLAIKCTNCLAQHCFADVYMFARDECVPSKASSYQHHIHPLCKRISFHYRINKPIHLLLSPPIANVHSHASSLPTPLRCSVLTD